MKNQTTRNIILIFVGLALLSGFVYLKWDNFTDVATNLINLKNSHPTQMVSYDTFLHYLENGAIKKVDLYENAELAVFDAFESFQKDLSPIIKRLFQ